MTPSIRRLVSFPAGYPAQRMSQAIARMLAATEREEKSRATKWALAWSRVVTPHRKLVNNSYSEMRKAIAKAAGSNANRND